VIKLLNRPAFDQYPSNKSLVNNWGGPKLALLPCSLILAYQGLEEESLDKKSPGLPCWGLMQQASLLLIGKEDC
jgi:hypothetical protein